MRPEVNDELQVRQGGQGDVRLLLGARELFELQLLQVGDEEPQSVEEVSS
ncbi:hypothetical protein [Streptomyces sp. TRM68367]|nr:hypothetical protein [Streptomyces sp. TRM68367]MBC9731529.1 hypothetical protein [Streptomyces sp. TRM68367]